MARRRPGDPLMRQVKQETNLRYQPAQSELRGARRQRYREYRSDIQTAEEVSGAVQRAAKESIPHLKQVFDDADQTAMEARGRIDSAVSLASMPQSALAMAILADREHSDRSLAGQRAQTFADTRERATRAVEGEAYAKRQALADYRGDRSEIIAKQRDLKREAGAFAQGRLGELRAAQDEAAMEMAEVERDQFNEDRKYALDVAKARGVDPVTGRKLDSKKPKGPSSADKRAWGTAYDSINKARTWIKNLQQGGNSPDAIRRLLTTGGSLPVPFSGRDAKGNPVEKIRQMEVPSIPSAFVNAAFDLNKTGKLSKGSVSALKRRGIRVPKKWVGPPSPQRQFSNKVLTETQKIAGQIRLGK